MRAPAGRLSPSQGSTKTLPLGRLRGSDWQNAVLMSPVWTSRSYINEIARKSISDSMDGVGAYT
eukprot:2361282-Pyramimonas_sp.AAC.1